MTKSIDELLRIFREKQDRDSEPYWGCCEPTNEKIEEFQHSGKRRIPWNNPPTSKRQRDCDWHLGKIVWFIVNWDGHPIKIKKDGSDIDGGHRLYTACYKRKTELEFEYY